ncbi:exported protein of unknown function [Streptantibioticus cattleyicolor NRRL 8057 = DSM 46488]|nr:exported protein of unknown function [Streptantibioticus cattleyicolor NRRL 8057 = DSM 46488]
MTRTARIRRVVAGTHTRPTGPTTQATLQGYLLSLTLAAWPTTPTPPGPERAAPEPPPTKRPRPSCRWPWDT